MKKTNISIAYDSEKLTAVQLYLSQKDLNLEGELCKALDILYGKVVPANVRDFLELRDQEPKKFVRKNKNTSAPAVQRDNNERSDSQ